MSYRAKNFLSIVLVMLAASFCTDASAASQDTYIIRALAGLHGTISPAGWIRASAGSNQTFTIQPKEGYRIKDVRVDRVSKGPITTYTFNNIQARHRIVAVFNRDKGQSSFSSAFPRGSGWFYRGGPEGGPLPPGATDTNKTPRAIEEGDIVKQYGNTLFVLNQYRGLQLIDITDSSKPSLLSTVPIYGTPVELYVRDGAAYVAVSNYLNCWYSPVKVETESFQGSRISVVDVRNPGAPEITGGIDIKGFITDTRIVGSILYAVSSKNSYYYYYDTADAENQTVITSISVADPAQVKIVNELPFPVTSSYYENNVHVTAETIFLSQYSPGYADKDGNWVQKDATDITIIDISDAAGAIKKGATFSMPGVVSNRWQMDFYEGYFRAITPEQSWGNGYPSLYIYKIENLETVSPVSSLTLKIDRPEALMSVRFDGTAAYAVTYERIDPLFTIDLKDPAQPRQLAEIQMTGWIDYIEPRTDHLVTLGHDDVDGTSALSVTLFDVTSLDNPLLVQRVNFGEYGSVPTDMNDLHKAFKVLDSLHLIMVPFSAWSYINNEQLSGAQLIDYYFDVNAKQLTKRGVIEHPGWIERALPYNDTTVMTVSNEAFQTVDISNRDKPQVIKALELARNSIDISSLSQDSALELSSDTRWSSYDQAQSKLSVVPLSNPNTPEPLDALTIKGYYDALFAMQNCALLSGYRYDETKGNVTVVKGVSYDGADFTLRGSLEISGLNNYPYPWMDRDASYYYFPYGQSEVKKISDTALVYSGYEYSYENPSNPSSNIVLKIVDAAAPDNLDIAASIKIDLQGGSPTRTLWQGSKAYVSYAVPAANDSTAYQYYYKCYFKVVDCADIYDPTVSEGINIPGYVVGASADGKYIYTIDYQYVTFPDSSLNTVYLNTLELDGGNAFLRDREIIIPATTANTEIYSIGNVVVNNEKAYYTVSHSACAADYSTCQYDAQLVTANLSNPDNIQFTSSQKLQGQGADIINVIQNKLFLYGYSGSGGIIIYTLANPLEPGFETFYRTDYYPGKIVVINNKACLPSGMYGVKVIPLQ